MNVHPTVNIDETITAIIAPAPPQMLNVKRLALRLPIERSTEPYAGRYFLARCGALDSPQNPQARFEQWSIYLRRPLFASSRRLNPLYTDDRGKPTEAIWEFLLPSLGKRNNQEETGEAWLATLSEGSPVNLIGPLGSGFSMRSVGGNLLLLAQNDGRLGALLPLVDSFLDKGGRVTLLIQGPAQLRQSLLDQLPIAAEMRLAQTESDWWQQAAEVMQWADQVAATISLERTQRLADIIREKRFRLLPDFAQILVQADLACGVGACLACVVPTASGGLTRACVHGPVFDLTRLAQ